MSDTILKQIREALRLFKEDFQFVVVNERYDPAAFGDAAVILQSKDFALRVIRDRDQIFADVGPADTDDWHDLKRVLAFLGHEGSDSSAFELNELALTLRAHHDELANLFSNTSYPLMGERLKQFEREKTKERLTMLSSRPS